MEDQEIPLAEPSNWQPISDPHVIAIFAKLGEEAGELISAKDRCLAQGLSGTEPRTGKLNKEWLEDEIADVLAMIRHTCDRLDLDVERIWLREAKKFTFKEKWLDGLRDAEEIPL